MITPRDYQQAIRQAIVEKWLEFTSTMAVMPTGTGKTIVFALLVGDVQPQRALVVAHREELIFQARDKIMETTGLDCSIEMGELMASNFAEFKRRFFRSYRRTNFKHVSAEIHAVSFLEVIGIVFHE